MTGWIIAGIIVLLIVLLLLIRVGVAAEYAWDGFGLRGRVGFVRFDLLRLIDKIKSRPKKEKKPKKPEKEEEKSKKGGSVKKLKELLPGILDFLRGFRKKLLVDELTIYFVSAAEEPSKAALNFGYASAAMGTIAAPLESVLNIKKRDFRTAVSFNDTENSVYLKAELSIRIGQLLHLALRFLVFMLKTRAKNKKGGEQNG